MNILLFILIIMLTSLSLLIFGYPVTVFFLTRTRINKPWRKEKHFPKITVIIPSHSEDVFIKQKIVNTVCQYPMGKMQIVVVYSNPVDKTLDTLMSFYKKSLISLIVEQHRTGKSNAINLALSKPTGEICVITDSDSLLGKSSLQRLVQAFADDHVGATSGELVYSSPIGLYETLFHKFKAILKSYEARLDSCSYAPGELLAFRKALINRIPTDSICDDYYILLDVRRRGYRCVYEPTAVVNETPPQTIKGQVARTRRVVAGTLVEATRFKSMFFNPRFGAFGLLIFPFYIIRIILIPLLTILLIPSFSLVLLEVPTLLLPILIFTLCLGFLSLFMGGARKLLNMSLYGFILSIAVFLGLTDYLKKNFSPIWDECK